MFKGKINKKYIIMLSFIVILTEFMGCGKGIFGIGKSDKEITSVFSDFQELFPSEDLMFLYEKGGAITEEELKKRNELLEAGIEEEYHSNGVWVVSTNFRNKEKRAHGVLVFNLDTREARGNLHLDYGEVDEEGEDIDYTYPIYYDKDGLHLVDENVDQIVKDEVKNFKFATEFLTLDKSYIKSLKPSKIRHSSKVGRYTANYLLTLEDKNVAKIKEIYPEFKIDEEHCKLNFETSNTGWRKSKDLEIILDEENDTSIEFSIRTDSIDTFDSINKVEESINLDEVEEEKEEFTVEELLEKYNDFFPMFTSKNLFSLYDKVGDISNVEDRMLDKKFELENGDLGCWNVSSYLIINDYEYEVDSTLRFNRNTRTVEGELSIVKDSYGKDYSISCNEEGMYLLDEDIPKEVKETLASFKMMNEFITLDEEYIKSLDFQKFREGLKCKLKPTDKNIAKIKSLYPKLEIDENNCALGLYGTGVPWDVGSYLSVKFYLDKDEKNKLSFVMFFDRGKDYSE